MEKIQTDILHYILRGRFCQQQAKIGADGCEGRHLKDYFINLLLIEAFHTKIPVKSGVFQIALPLSYFLENQIVSDYKIWAKRLYDCDISIVDSILIKLN